VVGGITRGKPGVSSYVDRVYDHLCENKKHEALHMIFGIDCREGDLSKEQVIEGEIAEKIMQPLGVEILNLPGRKCKTKYYKRSLVQLDLQLVLPHRTISNCYS
jgi:hypothetical protein